MKKFFLTYLIFILLPITAAADIIFFKDGMKTVCQDRAWEEGEEVKCEYMGLILTYQKKDVLRIEKVISTKQPEKPGHAKEVASKPAAKGGGAPAAADSQTPAKPSASGHKPQTSPPDPGSSKKTGLEFYNPRRPQKYWTGANAKHDTYQTAIAALAKQYDRSADWIQHYMGTTNDLDEIHRNLSSSKLDAPAEIESAESGDKPPEIPFYDPRRPHKYWTSASAQHDTLKEAISALAAAYGRTPEWVRQHMGDTNNLSEIHDNLTKSKAADSTP